MAQPSVHYKARGNFNELPSCRSTPTSPLLCAALISSLSLSFLWLHSYPSLISCVCFAGFVKYPHLPAITHFSALPPPPSPPPHFQASTLHHGRPSSLSASCSTSHSSTFARTHPIPQPLSLAALPRCLTFTSASCGSRCGRCCAASGQIRPAVSGNCKAPSRI